jgi:excisionase family DNA binding protein
MMTGEYLTTKEAAERLRVSVETARRWCRAGTLPTVRIGRAHRIPLSALLAFDPIHAAAEQPPAARSPAPAEPDERRTDEERTAPPVDEADVEPLPTGWTRLDPMPDEWDPSARPQGSPGRRMRIFG